MRRTTLPVVGLFSLFLLSACSQDVGISDPASKTKTFPLANSVVCTESRSVDYLKASIDSLMKVLTPNSNSAQSKFQAIVDSLEAGNVSYAQSQLQVLINFINLKYSQVNTAGVLIRDPETGDQLPVEQFKNNLLDELTCYVQLHSFDLNPGDPAKVFTNSDHSAGVYFPPGYVPQGFNVAISTPGSPPLLTVLDQYPSYIDIKLEDIDGNQPAPGTVFNGTPVVVVCFPTDDPNFTSEVAARALLGHQAASGFELLPSVSVPQQLADELTCGQSLPIQTSVIGKLIRKAADILLPEKLYARYFAFGGVGGSPEEFSPFGAVDGGVSYLGAGGSPEEFLKQSTVKQSSAKSAIPSLASLVLPGGITHVEGTAGEPDLTSPDSRLPRVRVTTPLQHPVAGATVTFTLSAPDATGSDPITGPDSDAQLCGGTSTTTVDVLTDAEGYAILPCLNFGTKFGYKNLKATFDPAGIDPLACIVKGTTCETGASSVNFLIETNAATATLSVAATVPPLVAVTVGTALQSLTATVADTYGNPFANQSITVAGTGLLCVGGGVTCQSGTTDAFGHVFFTNLTSQQAGVLQLTFTSGALTQNLNVTFNAAAASKIVLVPPPTGGSYGNVTAFTTLSPSPTVRTTDLYDNPVSANVFWSVAGGSTGATITPATGPWVSNASGISTVAWKVGDGGNGLTAYLGTSATGSSVSFTATTPTVQLAACTPSGTIKKTDLAKYRSDILGYRGYFSFPSKNAGVIRTAEVNMSVTGQSSGSGDYPTTLRAYRRNGSALGDLIATGKPTTSDQTLKLPGSNSNPTPVTFALTPTASGANAVASGEMVIFELQITAASTRTFQVWYNTKTTTGTDCYNTVLYAPGTTTPNFTTSSFLRGLHLKAGN